MIKSKTKIFSTSTSILIAFISGMIATLPALTAEQFVLDNETLLLAYFDESTIKADYANGNPVFAGAAIQTEGYYGKGADLRLKGFYPDYMNKYSTANPFYNMFGFWPAGNFNYYQGTLEFWFNLEKDNADGKLISAQNGLFSSNISLKNGKSLDIEWSSLKAEKIKDVVNLEQSLIHGKWHYFTMTWSPGEFVLFLDGRIIYTADMTNRIGITASRAIQPIWFGSSHYEADYLSMIIDELRISSTARYKDSFEPLWHNKQRPAYAYNKSKSIKRFPGKYQQIQATSQQEIKNSECNSPFDFNRLKLLFDSKRGLFRIQSGEIFSSEYGGISVFSGLERKPCLPVTDINDWKNENGVLQFSQVSGSGIKIKNCIKNDADTLRWNVELVNDNDTEEWLEVLLTLPADFIEAKEYFDGNTSQEKLMLPRRKDTVISAMPLAIISDGRKSLGVGIDPHQWLSAYISEWTPRSGTKGRLSQGTKIALSPKTSYTLNFILFYAEKNFGFLDVLDAYHSTAPDLYKVRKNISPRFNMPLALYKSHKGINRKDYGAQAADFARQTYGGVEWLFGPHHVIGDSWASEEYYNNPKQFNRHGYEEMKRFYKWYGSTINEYKQSFIKVFKGGYETYYTGGALHLHPNWPWLGIIEDKYPEGISEGDRLDCGQYYSHEYYYQMNNYNTPVGEKNKKDYKEIINFINPYILGFINDLCYVNNARCYDPVAKKTPGRAFAPDIGTYILDAYGVADYFKTIQSFNKGTISDGGWANHIMSTVSDKTAAEDGTGFLAHTNLHEMYKSGRYMLGEKPFDFFGVKDNLKISSVIPSFSEMSEKELRDYYSYVYEQRFLAASSIGGIYSLNLLRGFPKLFSCRPMLVEGVMSGVKTVSAATVNKPLWTVRYGNALDSIITVGNQSPEKITSDIKIFNSYLGPCKYVFTDFFGGNILINELISDNTVIKNMAVEPRSLIGLRCVAGINGEVEKANVSYSGDGITFTLNLSFAGLKSEKLTVIPFIPDQYEITKVYIDNKEHDKDKIVINDNSRINEVTIEYRNKILAFSAGDWDKVTLLDNNRINYKIITSKDADDYDKNTAKWINSFFYAYDEENGNPDDIDFKNVPNSAWKIYYRANNTVQNAGPLVKIDSNKKSIYISGQDKESARLSMSVFLRLLDRRYIHVGNWYTPLNFNFKTGEVLGGTRKGGDPALSELYRKYDFDKKVLLEKNELNNFKTLDFTNKYKLNFSPYIYEPARF